MADLVPVLPGRPPIVKHAGQYVYVSVHDHAYLQRRAALLARLADAHPDASGAAAVFRSRRRAYERWLQEEVRWYAELGLEPPRPSEGIVRPAYPKPSHRCCRACQRRISAGNRGGLCRRCALAVVRTAPRPTSGGVLLNYRPLRHASEDARTKITLITYRRSQKPHGTRKGDRRNPALVAAMIARRRVVWAPGA